MLKNPRSSGTKMLSGEEVKERIQQLIANEYSQDELRAFQVVALWQIAAELDEIRFLLRKG
jgi:hypothetical protein